MLAFWSTRADAQPFEYLEGYIGVADSTIARIFGAPDEIGTNEAKDAVVWTYLVKSEDESRVSLELRQFAFWNGRVADISLRSPSEDPGRVYTAALDFIRAGGSTIARSANPDTTLFTDNLRIARRGDNIWLVDMFANGPESHTTIMVGDAGFRGCEQVLRSELARVRAKFGVDLR